MVMDPARLALPVTLAVAVLIALPGCGSDDGSASTAAPAASTPSASTSTPATTASTAAAAPSGPEKVEIKDFDYSPKRESIAVGTKVTWTNADAANHTVTFDAGAKKSLGNQPKGKSVSMTFTKAGTYAYHCDYHPNMHGTVVVK